MNKEFDENYFEEKSAFLHALAHPVRLKILEIIKDSKACVGDISAIMKIKQPNISQHLNILKNAGILKKQRNGKMIYYEIIVLKVINVLKEIDGAMRN